MEILEALDEVDRVAVREPKVYPTITTARTFNGRYILFRNSAWAYLDLERTLEGVFHKNDVENINGENYFKGFLYQCQYSGKVFKYPSALAKVWKEDKLISVEDCKDYGYVHLQYGQAAGFCVHEDMVTYCEDIEDYVLEDEATYDELADDYRYRTDNMVWDYDSEVFAHRESFRTSDDYRFIREGRADGYYLHTDISRYCSDLDDWVHEEDATYDELSEEYFYDDDNFHHDYHENVYAHEDSFQYTDGFVWVEHGTAAGNWLDRDYATYCADIDGYVLDDDAHYIDDDDEYVFNASARLPFKISDYHSSGYPRNLAIGEYYTPYRIGFEVEKSEFPSDREYKSSYRIFKGIEKDASCGYEAITHILPLGNSRSEARKYVQQMMNEAESILTCPVTGQCGGHINLSVIGMTGSDLLDAIRPYLAIVYALYRFRLKNRYSSGNKKLRPASERYATVLTHDYYIEVRLPNRVINVNTLMNRYDLMYRIIHYAVWERLSYPKFIEKIRPLIVRMYNGDKEKAERVIQLSFHFRDYIVLDIEAPEIKEFINND